MRIGTFEPGTEVLLQGKRYRIHKVVGVERVLLIDEGSGSLRTADLQALDFINPGNAVLRGRGIDLADVPEEHRHILRTGSLDDLLEAERDPRRSHPGPATPRRRP